MRERARKASTLADSLRSTDLEFLAGTDAVLARGAELFRQGQVRILDMDETRVKGLVQGSARTPYAVVVSEDEEGPFTQCTCPYAQEWGSCKHGIALALGYLSLHSRSGVAAFPPRASSPPPLLPASVTLLPYLEQLPVLALVTPEGASARYPAPHDLPRELLPELQQHGLTTWSIGQLARKPLPPELSHRTRMQLAASLRGKAWERPTSPSIGIPPGVGGTALSVCQSLRRLFHAGDGRRPPPPPGEHDFETRWNTPLPSARYSEVRPVFDSQGGVVFPDVALTVEADGKVSAQCNCAEASAVPVCVHIGFAARSWLWLLHQPQEQAAFLDALQRPVWQRALETFQSLSPERSSKSKSIELRWTVSHAAELGAWSVSPAVHSARRDGTWGNGQRVTAAHVKALESELSTEERQALDIWLDRDPTTSRLTHPQVVRLLSHLVDCKRVCSEEERPVAVRVARLSLSIEGEPHTQLRIRALLDNEPIDAPTARALSTSRHHRGTLLRWRPEALTNIAELGERILELIHLPERASALLDYVSESGFALPSEAVEPFLATLPSLERQLKVDAPEWLQPKEVPPSEARLLRLQALPGSGLRLVFLAVPLEGVPGLPPGTGPQTLTTWQGNCRVTTQRSFAEERQRFEQDCRALRLEDDPSSERVLTDDASALAVLQSLEDALPSGLRVEWVDRPLRVRRLKELDKLHVVVKAGMDWFGVRGSLEDLELAAVLDAARRDQPFVRDGETLYHLSDQLRQRLQRLADVTHRSPHGLETSPFAVSVFTELRGEGIDVDLPQPLEDLAKRIAAAGKKTPKLPRGLKATLRPYQSEGFEWMARLAAWGGAGCLADDMGLGKTVQTLALLLHRAPEGPALVAAPTSVCFNWENEAKRFAPSLRVRDYRGSERAELLEGLTAQDLVLTSHTLLARDVEQFAKHRWATLVIDEAQAFKNPDSLRARAVRELEADARFTLTGTPIENRLDELWSMFRVLFPGLLGSRESFRKSFALPIEQSGDAKRRDALLRIVQPFILRRTKKEVAKDLPAKTELIEHITLSPAERRLYEDARGAALYELTKPRRKEGGPEETQRFQILAALTRLRMLACDPQLVDPTSKVPSSKLARLVSLVAELSSEGHRVLVFSQFLGTLAVAKKGLEAEGLKVLTLDGTTPAPERRSLVESFQRGDANCFLISLKAGGSGLNLTAANHVIHVDPWWNPAAEDQASDRAHRIGQNQPVTVIRLVSKGTIEESILALHAKKRELVEKVLQGTDAGLHLSPEQMIELLREVREEVG